MKKPAMVEKNEQDPLFTPKEVCEMFGVHARTLLRWTNEGKLGKEGIGWIRTVCGHRRFRQSAVNALKAMRESE